MALAAREGSLALGRASKDTASLRPEKAIRSIRVRGGASLTPRQRPGATFERAAGLVSSKETGAPLDYHEVHEHTIRVPERVFGVCGSRRWTEVRLSRVSREGILQPVA